MYNRLVQCCLSDDNVINGHPTIDMHFTHK